MLSLEEAKIWLDYTGSDRDVLITTLIESVQALLESFCDRHFSFDSYTEYYDGLGFNYVLLDQYPVQDITGVWDDTNREFTDVMKIESTSYTVYKNIGMIMLTDGSVFTKGYRNVKVEYTAGYTEIPADLKMIAGEIIVKKWKNIIDHRVGISSVSSAGEGFNLSLNDLLPDHKAILYSRYRRHGSR